MNRNIVMLAIFIFFSWNIKITNLLDICQPPPSTVLNAFSHLKQFILNKEYMVFYAKDRIIKYYVV